MRKFNQLLRSWGDGLDPNHRPHMGFHIFQLRCFNCLSYIDCVFLALDIFCYSKCASDFSCNFFSNGGGGGGALPGILAWIGLLVLCIVED